MNAEEKQKEFLKLYESCRESLVRFSRAISRNREDAQDLVQETTLKAYDSFDKLQNPRAFTSYLFTIATRLNKRNNWRKRLFASFSEDDYSEAPFETLRSNDAPADSNYDIIVLHKALQKLPAKQKEALVLYEISGLSMEEISKVQDASIPAVKSRVLRGRKALAKILGVKDDAKNNGENLNYGIKDKISNIDSSKVSLFSDVVEQGVVHE